MHLVFFVQAADNFNPRSPYGERRCFSARWTVASSISIHAPLTGSDWCGSPYRFAYLDFNPRSPYGERRSAQLHGGIWSRFQSTLPLRGATMYIDLGAAKGVISIHAPLTGSDALAHHFLRQLAISIHAPLTGSDLPIGLPHAGGLDFNPRSPYGERPWNPKSDCLRIYISIHAPLTGSDPFAPITAFHCGRFQSTLPLRGATCYGEVYARGK